MSNRVGTYFLNKKGQREVISLQQDTAPRPTPLDHDSKVSPRDDLTSFDAIRDSLLKQSVRQDEDRGEDQNSVFPMSMTVGIVRLEDGEIKKIDLLYRDAQHISQNYLHVEWGGLFIPTPIGFHIGQPLLLSINLFAQLDRCWQIPATVIWRRRGVGNLNGTTPGVGIGFAEGYDPISSLQGDSMLQDPILRACERVRVRWQTEAKRFGYHTGGARLFDLSTSGAFIETDHPDRIGKKLELKMKLESSIRELRLSARVVWNRRESIGLLPAGMGVKFCNPQEAAANQLVAYLDENRLKIPSLWHQKALKEPR